MFRDLKEYQDITKIYQSKVYTEDYSKEITEAFESEEFTEEEVAYIEENFDSLLEEVIEEEEETLSEQVTGRQKGKMLRQTANEILSDIKKSPVAKNTPVSSKVIQGKPAGVVGKFKSALSKVGSKIGNVAKTAVKTGAAPFKSGGVVSNIGKQASKVGGKVGTSGIVRKGAKLLSKMGSAGKLAAVAGLTGAALLANRKKIKAAADKAKVDKYVANRKGDKPIEKIDAKQFDNRRDPSPESDTSSTPVVSDKTKQGKTRTKAQMMAAKRIASGKSIADVKQDNTDAMKARAAARFKAFKAKRAEKKLDKQRDSDDPDKIMNRGESYTPDAYDMVLEYLLSSEQAATIEEANYVMTEMDAETIQGIVEEQKKNLDEGIASMALKTGAAVLGGVLAKKGLDKGKKSFDNYLNKQRDKGIGGNTRPGSDKIYYGK